MDGKKRYFQFLGDGFSWCHTVASQEMLKNMAKASKSSDRRVQPGDDAQHPGTRDHQFGRDLYPFVCYIQVNRFKHPMEIIWGGDLWDLYGTIQPACSFFVHQTVVQLSVR